MNARRRPCSAGPLQGGAVALASGLPGWASTAGPGLSETARPPLGGWGLASAAGLGLSETASPALGGWGLAYDRPFALAPSPPCRGYAPRRRAPLPVPWCGGAIS